MQLGYQKQKSEAIEQHRGFQSLDATQHPVVQQHKKASELQSSVSLTCIYSILVVEFSSCSTT